MKKLLLCLIIGGTFSIAQGMTFLEAYHQGVTLYEQAFLGDQPKIEREAKWLKERLLTYSPARLTAIAETLNITVPKESLVSTGFLAAYKLLVTKKQKVSTQIKKELLTYTEKEGKNLIDQPLIAAASGGEVAAINALLAAGANIETKDSYGMTALMWAAH